MTVENKTKMIMFSILAVTLIAGTITAVDASPKGKDIIIQEKTKNSNPDLERMKEIVASLNSDSITETDRTNLINEANQLREKAISQNPIDEQKRIEASDAHLSFREVFHGNTQFADLDEIKSVIVGHGIAGDQYIVDINEEYWNEENLPKIISAVRNVVGDKIDIEFYKSSKIVPTACSSQTGDCSPIEGGVQYENESGIPCSIGFQAEYDGTTEGFIVAGHCVSTSSSGDEVYQPDKDFFGFNKAGDVTDDAFTGSGTTTCDCAFVDADESVEDEIFSNIQADVIGSIVMNDYMTTKGMNSTSFTGQISATVYDTSYGGVNVDDQFKVDEPAKSGDSGGPTYESGAQYPDLMGFVVATSSTESVHSKASNVDDELTDVLLDFS